MKKRIAFVLVLLLLLSCTLPVAAVAPADDAVAAAHLAVSNAVGTDTPGAAVVLLEGGILKVMDGFGYADLDTRVLVTPDTVFEIGDFSALFVAIAALQLADDGALSLDADIAAYLPERFMSKLDLTYPVTTRQLLSGRAGFGGRLFDLSFKKPEHGFESLEEALLADVPAQILAPDTVSHYSPFGVALVAFLIENVTGVSYEKYVEAEILSPLGMKDTVLRFSDDESSQKTAAGYVCQADGSFTAAPRAGRSYAGLYPATGALSTAADMARFLAWLVSPANDTVREQLLATASSDVFGRGGMVLTAVGTRAVLQTATAYFSLSFSLDHASGSAAMVLANVSDTALLDLPAAYLPLVGNASSLPDGEMLDLKDLRGTYVSADAEFRTFVGRLDVAEKRISVRVNDDGTLQFLDMRLVQIARGVFADADADTNQPVVQFLLDEEGEVSAILTSSGDVYTSLPFYLSRVPAALLYGLLLLLTAWFLISGVFALLRYITDRYNGDRSERAVVLIPQLVALLLAAFVGMQVLVAYRMGAFALSSFYFAMRVMTLLAAIGTTVAYIIGFVATMIEREQHRRIAYTGIMLVVYLFLVGFWGLTII